MIQKAQSRDAIDIHGMMESQKILGDIFYVDTLDFVKKHIRDTWVFTVDGLPHAYLLCRVPKKEKDNLGYDIGLTKGKDLLKVVHMESCVVEPELRGNRLMQQLLGVAIREYTAKGFNRIMATVHPDNKASLNSLLAVGLQIVDTKEKYGGVPRHIMLKQV